MHKPHQSLPVYQVITASQTLALSFLLTVPLSQGVGQEPSARPEAVWAEVEQLRMSLDHQLEQSRSAVKEDDLRSAAKAVATTSLKLDEKLQIFSHFQQNSNALEATRLSFLAFAVRCIVGGPSRLPTLNAGIERVTSCTFQAFLAREAPARVEQAAQFQLAAQHGLTGGLLSAQPFYPTNQGLFFPMLVLARRLPNDLGTELAKNLLLATNAPEFVTNAAKKLIERRWGLGAEPKLEFTAIDGRQVTLSALRGRAVLITFWATDCVPCMQELPELKSIYDRFHPKGFEVLGISLDEKKQRFLRAIKENSIPWPNRFSSDRSEDKCLLEFGVQAIPDNWLIDKRGKVREVGVRERLEEKIALLVSEKQ